MKCAKREIKKDNSMTYFSLVFLYTTWNIPKEVYGVCRTYIKRIFFLQIRFCTLSFYDDH